MNAEIIKRGSIRSGGRHVAWTMWRSKDAEGRTVYAISPPPFEPDALTYNTQKAAMAAFREDTAKAEEFNGWFTIFCKKMVRR